MVGATLLPHDAPSPEIGPAIKPQSVWVNADPAVAAALQPAFEAVQRVVGEEVRVEGTPGLLLETYEHFRCIQAQEAWATLGGWIERAKPHFGPGVGERFAAARAMDAAKAAAGRAFRRRFVLRARGLLAGGGVLVFPTSPLPAPLLGASPAEQNAVRERTMGVTAIAGLAGLPEVTIPAAHVEGAPVGLSLVAAPGRDRALLALAERVAAELGLPT